MKKLSLILFLILGFSLPSYAVESIKMNVTATGFPPFLFNEKQREGQGLLVDVMRYIARRHGYTVKTIGLPKKRAEIQLISGEIDAQPTAKEWVRRPDNYIFTDVIVHVEDALYSLKSAPIKFAAVEDLFGKILSVHYAYLYPMLDQYLSSGEIVTRTENSELLLLKATLFELSDAAVINDRVAKWLIKRNPLLQGQFKVAEKRVGSFEYRIMFNKKWHDYVKLFNLELAKMKKNGELQKILARYE